VLTSLDHLLLMSNTVFTLYKTSYLNEELNCTESSLSVSVPWKRTFLLQKRFKIFLFPSALNYMLLHFSFIFFEKGQYSFCLSPPFFLQITISNIQNIPQLQLIPVNDIKNFLFSFPNSNLHVYTTE
jgi:hypothetical protein